MRDRFEKVYSKFSDEVFAEVRRETFGDDIGQYSWTSRSEFERILRALDLQAEHWLLDVGCGAGGPALFAARATGCAVVGVDANARAIETASRMAREQGLDPRATFRIADASLALPFDNASFDSIICIDAIVFFARRLAVLQDWRRLLRAGGRVLFTDPGVVTGLVSDGEISTRSLDAKFVFSPVGEDERLIREAGLSLTSSEDSTATLERVSGAWQLSRARHEQQLAKLEGPGEFLRQQRYYENVHRLAQERRLSRFTFLASRSQP